MKVFWWQGGLHLEPENSEDASALRVLSSSLHIVDVVKNVNTGPICGDLRNEKPVVGVHK